MAVTAETAARLLDLTVPLDVSTLDALVAAFYGAGSTDEVLKCTLFATARRILLYFWSWREFQGLFGISVASLCMASCFVDR
jgi:hypothetical protein